MKTRIKLYGKDPEVLAVAWSRYCNGVNCDETCAYWREGEATCIFKWPFDKPTAAEIKEWKELQSKAKEVGK